MLRSVRGVRDTETDRSSEYQRHPAPSWALLPSGWRSISAAAWAESMSHGSMAVASLGLGTWTPEASSVEGWGGWAAGCSLEHAASGIANASTENVQIRNLPKPCCISGLLLNFSGVNGSVGFRLLVLSERFFISLYFLLKEISNNI